MREIISRRNKKQYFFLLVISVVTIIASAQYWRVPMLRYIVFPALIALFLHSVMYIFLLANSHGAIEQVDDTIVIRRGIRKTVINRNDILDVLPMPHPNKPNEIQKNVISIKVLVNGKEKTLVCGDVSDVEFALKKLSGLIRQS